MFVYFTEQNGNEGTKNNQWLLCILDLFLDFFSSYSWQSLMKTVITVNQTWQVSSEHQQLWKTCFLLFFQTDEILLKKSKKIWHVKPTFCTDPLNLFTFLSLSDAARRSKSLAADSSKCLKAKATWLCEDGRLGRQRSHSGQETSGKHCILCIYQFIT